MLVTFFALSTAVAIVIQRSWTEKGIVVLSAIPIAIIANVARITLTGVLYVSVGAGTARVVFHDLAGWLMMPFACLLLCAGAEADGKAICSSGIQWSVATRSGVATDAPSRRRE